MFFDLSLTLSATQRTQRRIAEKTSENSFLVFETHTKKQYTGTRGIFPGETIRIFTTEFLLQIKI